MLYCEYCKMTYENGRCPSCGNKRGREAQPDDICFLTEVEQLWSEMLCDVLDSKSIPHICKNLRGAAITVRIGSVYERVEVFVKYKDLEAAKQVVEELFETPVDENDFPEETDDGGEDDGE